MKALKAADHQSGPHEKDQRQGDLGHYQDASRAVAGSIGIGASQALFERLADIFPGKAETGQQSGQQARDQRYGRSEDEHLRIKTNFDRGRNFIRQKRHDQANSQWGEAQPKGPTYERQQHGFGQYLPQYATRTRSQCRANRNLFLPPEGSGQDQIGDVDASDQQDAGHRPQ